MSVEEAVVPTAGTETPARGFLFDLNRCTGCNACELACSTENELEWGRSWRHVATFNEARQPGLPTFHLSLACNHCAEAPCLDQCPALAIRRDAVTDAVLIEADRCIGCRYCAWVCPYDAPRFDDRARVMGKCTLCNPRLAEDRSPACVEGCPTAALRFGALEGEEAVPGFPETPARPAIRFQPLLRGMEPPESTWSAPEEVLASFRDARPDPRPDPRPKISLGSEWPLLVFSLIAAAMAGWILSAVAGGSAPGPGGFLAAAAAAMAASMLHLGRKERAWRAILNLHRSWLSREVLSFAGFAALSLAYLRPAGASEGAASVWAGAGAAALGSACLFCMDRVYDPVRGGSRVHSADSLLTGLLLAAILAAWPPGILLLGGAKLLLYLRRLPGALSRPAGSPGRSAMPLLGPLRIGLGFLLPSLLWLARPEIQPDWTFIAFAAFAAGEVIDRAQFYVELEVPTPRALLQAESTAWRPAPVPDAAS